MKVLNRHEIMRSEADRKGNMKKKTFFTVAAAMLLLSGCAEKKGDSAGYQVYYSNEDGDTLLSAGYQIMGDDTLACIQEMWKKMQDTMQGNGQSSLVPEKLEIQELDLTGGQLTVTFNSEYYNMSTIQEVLLRAGLVEGVTQFQDVKTVVFHVGDDVLRDHKGEPVGAMTRGTFIHNPVGINSYQYASLTLYFSNLTGDHIVKEMRNVHYSTNTVIEKVILEQLTAGPMNTRLSSVLNDNVKVLDIGVEDKTCTLNLNQAFLDTAKGMARPEVILYAVVDTLCDNLSVDKVQFQVEGSSDVVFGDSLSLAGPFHRNSEIIEVQDSTMEESDSVDSTDLGEPQIGL